MALIIRNGFFGLIAVLTLWVGPAAAGGKINSSFFGKVAIEGYDPVAYFTRAKPVEGKSAFEHQWKGAKWRFATARNRDRFAAVPDRFAPKYGGYCAWAVSQGYTASIDPEAWRIVDGKLYLNYSKSVQAQWTADIAGNIKKGDTNWPKIEAGL